MAKQLGTEIKGRMDDYSFYRDRLHGYLVRKTGGVTSTQYKTDQRYEAARKASSEFAVVSRAGKLIRDAFSPFIKQITDGTMVNRLNRELVALKQADIQNCKGERRPETMMTDGKSNKWMRIFQFNEHVKLYDLFNYSEGSFTGTSLKLALARRFPEGATYAGLTLVRSVIDFKKGIFETHASKMILMDLTKSLEKRLNIPESTSIQGIEIVCLQVVFFREVEGKLLQLSKKVHSMGIVSITNYVEQVQDQNTSSYRIRIPNLSGRESRTAVKLYDLFNFREESFTDTNLKLLPARRCGPETRDELYHSRLPVAAVCKALASSEYEGIFNSS